MISIILFNPAIPPNTGNIMRLCSNTGFSLHLIKPIGFSLDDKLLKRAKMDYYSDVNPIIHERIEDCIETFGKENIIAISKFGEKKYTDAKFSTKSALLFGSEISGLPNKIRDLLKSNLYNIPMVEKNRSLNLSNAVAIVAYEAWKNLKFCSFKY